MCRLLIISVSVSESEAAWLLDGPVYNFGMLWNTKDNIDIGKLCSDPNEDGEGEIFCKIAELPDNQGIYYGQTWQRFFVFPNSFCDQEKRFSLEEKVVSWDDLLGWLEESTTDLQAWILEAQVNYDWNELGLEFINQITQENYNLGGFENQLKVLSHIQSDGENFMNFPGFQYCQEKGTNSVWFGGNEYWKNIFWLKPDAVFTATHEKLSEFSVSFTNGLENEKPNLIYLDNSGGFKVRGRFHIPNQNCMSWDDYKDVVEGFFGSWYGFEFNADVGYYFESCNGNILRAFPIEENLYRVEIILEKELTTCNYWEFFK